MAHIQMNFYSNALLKNANVTVFLPTQDADDYLFGDGNAKYDPAKKYQTLYLLHGSYGDCSDWSRLACVERYAQAHCLAVVMPSGENSAYLNMDAGENYLDYIGRELPDFLRTVFPLSPRREDNFIAGLSMGGYGCMRVGLEFPERFAAIASLSGALDLNSFHEHGGPHIEKMDPRYKRAVYGDRELKGSRNDLLYLLKSNLAEGKPMPKLYMTIGTEDFLYPVNETFYAKAKELADIRYETFPGVHDWIFWDAHIQDVLNWLPLAEGKVDA